MFQDFKLLAFSVGENVACSEDYDERKVWDCLKMAGAYDRVKEFPNGLKQPIYKLYDKEGADLSGGEANCVEYKPRLETALFPFRCVIVIARRQPCVFLCLAKRKNTSFQGRRFILF